MITKLRISNFASIGNELDLDFTKGTTNKSGYLKTKIGSVSLLNGFYGANASGKSNILKGLNTTLKIMYTKVVPDSVTNVSTILLQNYHNEFKDKPTTLGIDLLISNHYYKYDISIIGGNQIISEKLSVTNIGIKNAKPKEVFTRDDKKISFGPEYKDHEQYFTAVKLPEYQTLMSHIIEGFHAGEDFRTFRDNNLLFAKTDEMDSIPSFFIAIQHALKMNSAETTKKEEMVKLTKSIMSRFDKTIEGIDIDNKGFSIKIKHNDFYESVNLQQESAGTRELFAYIYDVLNTFRNGGVVIYDETNRFFHPEIEQTLISLFKSRDLNTKNAQLFFASHNTDTLDLLNLDQIFIVEKNKCTTVSKVSDIGEIRSRDNLKRKYNLGMIGGTPDIIEFDHMIKQFI